MQQNYKNQRLVQGHLASIFLEQPAHQTLTIPGTQVKKAWLNFPNLIQQSIVSIKSVDEASFFYGISCVKYTHVVAFD